MKIEKFNRQNVKEVNAKLKEVSYLVIHNKAI